MVGEEGKDLRINQETIKKTKYYNYLGITITKDGKDHKEIIRKVVRGGEQNEFICKEVNIFFKKIFYFHPVY